MDITSISAYEMRKKIIDREISVTDIARDYLKRIDQEEDARVFAFITVDEEGVLEQARLIDEKISRGEELGSLVGLPIVIKDNISSKGMKTTCGSKMLEDYVAPFDATIIELIKKEDGLIIGKTNLDEFAVGSSTEKSYYGVTYNPVDKTLVSGGSSGGSAAAVKSDQAVLGVGTDTGGSVRQPAAFCDVVGIKPSYGSISRHGIVTMASSLDQAGIFAEEVRDAAIFLDVLMEHDSKDSTSYTGAGEILKDLDLEASYSLEGLKFAFPMEFKEVLEDEEIIKHLDTIFKSIEELGGIIEEVSIPRLKFAPAIYHAISTAELSSSMARYDGIVYGYRADDYSDLDQLYKKSRSQSLGEELKRRIVVGNLVLSEKYRDRFYNKSLKLRRLLKEDFDRVFEDYDFIISPTSPTLPFEIGSSNDTDLQYKSDMFTVSANLIGRPAMSLPSGYIKNRPFGIQFMADYYREDKLIKAGLAFEGGHKNEL